MTRRSQELQQLPEARGVAGIPSAYDNFLNPSLEDEMRRLVYRFGSEAVRGAARDATKRKRGAKRLPDWKELAPEIELDAIDWLEGRNPLKLRTNYRIAKAFCERNPGQSAVSTHRRIMAKLAEGRVRIGLYHACDKAEAGRPHGEYFRAVSLLAEHCPAWGALVERSADTYRGAIVRYSQRYGEPDSAMTVREIDARVNSAVNALLGFGNPPPKGGLFGLAGSGKIPPN